jgi:glutamate synthase (NADPH) small chain
VAEPRGFLEVRRRTAGYRPVAARLRDHREQALAPPPGLAREQARRCMDCGVPFCQSGCPLGNAIPDWNELVRVGGWQQAAERLAATNNFPELTGKLCPAPCEEACVLSLNDEPVTIKQIELAIAQRSFDEGWVRPQPPAQRSGHRVAVVGSGPAGLAAAQQLTRAGHAVTVFERDERAGGLLRFGIPDYKLDKAVVDRRIDQMQAEGTCFELGCEVDRDLRGEFAAVVLATGAQRHRRLDLPGRELAGIEPALPYLVECNREAAGLAPRRPRPLVRGRHVVVLGAGDTSADCLGNCLRAGAASVTEVAHGEQPPTQRDPQGTWPEWPRVLRSHPVHAEGGSREWRFETARFVGEGGRLTGLADDQGRMLRADVVLLAIGFAGVEPGAVLEAHGVAVSARGTLAPHPAPGVFAAGDCVLGADLIVSAIAQGRQAAAAVELHLAAAA